KAHCYKILKAASVLDAGKVINPLAAKSVTMGGMSMGLSLASREAFLYDEKGIILNANLRDYKLIGSGEEPDFLVEFLETPELDGPFGARGIGEHGLIGMPAALINSLSSAAQIDLNKLPLTPEQIWQTKEGSG
ncbi:MAG TPA: molybdopterin-dependent oxidoreductase, partial [Clostridia bacterium]|nr:molybdopterin-dependent oxidoreductase [Clostridia bacterium]